MKPQIFTDEHRFLKQTKTKIFFNYFISSYLCAIIFNALVIICLIPLALRGVKYRPLSAATLLQRNLLIYGLGRLIVPFIGIKIIDLIITTLGLA
jgi:K+-transporting ATPase ATPase B chain